MGRPTRPTSTSKLRECTAPAPSPRPCSRGRPISMGVSPFIATIALLRPAGAGQAFPNTHTWQAQCFPIGYNHPLELISIYSYRASEVKRRAALQPLYCNSSFTRLSGICSLIGINSNISPCQLSPWGRTGGGQVEAGRAFAGLTLLDADVKTAITRGYTSVG